MLNIISALEWELNRINRMVMALQRNGIKSESVPVFVKRKNDISYYYKYARKNGKRKQVYLGTIDSPKLKSVVDSSFKAEMLKILKYDHDLLSKVLKLFRKYSTADVLTRLSPCLADYPIKTVFDDAMNELYRWTNMQYDKNSYPIKGPEILTVDGTRVRSKSECIIYNALRYAMIPFRYEPFLEFDSPDPAKSGMSEYFAPDFMIKCLDGSYIIIEHAGMLGSKNYSDELSWKLRVYCYNNYVPNVNLFITADGPDGSIDTQALSQLIETIWWRILK
ncbi:MAG: hypothetical protein IKF07_07585 [Eubacterium sp.]|nr:hypothetical protein [Eubacterium sp.]